MSVIHPPSGYKRRRFNADRCWRGISWRLCRRIREARAASAARADGFRHRTNGKVTRLPD
jgi:hypothetical protein